MYLISDRDLETILHAIEVMEYVSGESNRVHNSKMVAKVTARKLRKRFKRK